MRKDGKMMKFFKITMVDEDGRRLSVKIQDDVLSMCGAPFPEPRDYVLGQCGMIFETLRKDRADKKL